MSCLIVDQIFVFEREDGTVSESNGSSSDTAVGLMRRTSGERDTIAVMESEGEGWFAEVADTDGLDIHQTHCISESRLQNISHYRSSVSHRSVKTLVYDIVAARLCIL